MQAILFKGIDWNMAVISMHISRRKIGQLSKKGARINSGEAIILNNFNALINFINQ